MLELTAGHYRLALDPPRGGSVAALEWRGQPLLRATCGSSILETACFPLVPFSNRIANGQFVANGRSITLPPNHAVDARNPLHGYGWLAEWKVIAANRTRVVIEHRHDAGDWPWKYVARQEFSLDADGLTIALSLQNYSNEPMPAGIGFHPYFPRDRDTRYLGRHRGEWHNDEACLPLFLAERDVAIDWWAGEPVGMRDVDTVYTDREGALSVLWPSRKLLVEMSPSPDLSFTVVYTPADEPFFCIEPVGTMTDAVNATDRPSGLTWLEPDRCITSSIGMTARLPDQTPTRSLFSS